MGCAVNSTSRRWNSGIVPFVINPEVTGVNAIFDAIARWESVTNIRFVRRTREADYLEFVLDAGAVGIGYSSTHGKNGGRQIIAFSGSSDPGLIIHEIGHALGLIHEHKRSDRDKFVKIHFENIKPSARSQFEKESDTLNSVDYDYKSRMHYRAFASVFAIDPSKPLIEPLDPSIPLSDLGSSMDLTTGDIAMINSIYPNVGVVRRSGSQHGASTVAEIASVSSGSNIVTAVKAGNGNLRMIRWNVDNVGGIQRETFIDAPDSAGAASSVSVAQAGPYFVAALQNGSGNLVLISYQFSNNQFTRVADSGALAGAASLIKVINLSPSLLLTACRTAAGDLKLILWQVDAQGRFTRVTDSGTQAGAVSEISLVRISSNSTEHLVATSVRAGDGTVKVITWTIPVAGNSITRKGDSASQIGAGTQIQSAVDQYGHLIVSCRSGSGNLVLISLSVTDAGKTISRLNDSHSLAGAITTNSLITRPYGVVSGVRDGSGNLRLIKWSINAAGQFTRLGDSGASAGEVSLICLNSFAANVEAPLCTPVKDGSGNLFLISWDDEPRVGELQH